MHYEASPLCTILPCVCTYPGQRCTTQSVCMTDWVSAILSTQYLNITVDTVIQIGWPKNIQIVF